MGPERVFFSLVLHAEYLVSSEYIFVHLYVTFATSLLPLSISCTRQCHSLNDHVVPTLVSSFLASIEAMGEQKGASDARWGSTKGQAAPEGARLLCRALRPTTGISCFGQRLPQFFLERKV